METNFLLPNKYKSIGWIILGFSFILWLFNLILPQEENQLFNTKVFVLVGSELFKGGTQYFSIINANIIYTIIGALFIIGGLLVVFSKEKIEDEFIAKLRLQSFQWSFLINYLLLLLLFLFVYGMEFFNVLIYNMFTMLILFIFRFEYLLFKNKI